MRKTTYITTPIYYSSGNVHIGNSYSTIACDAFARFKRLKGNDTFYLTGMDEHGQKIEEAAKKLNITPQKLTDNIAIETQGLWKRLNISNDYFIRTTDKNHYKSVQEIFQKLLDKDDIYLGNYEGDYCVSCETFYSKTQITSKDTCPDCGKALSKVKEECYFLRMSKYQNKLLKYIKDNFDFIQPETRRNEVISFIESGLEDLAVSRTTFKWGIQVKSDPKHVVYVWIDALSNYISALNYNTDDKSLFQKYWLNGDEVYHVIGKDILRFHAIIWPIILICLEIPIKFKLLIHGWYLVNGRKMSKSTGNIVYPDDVINKYGLDSLRYYLLKELPLGNDANFTYERFLEKHNSDLVNDLGNLLKRTITMINKYLNGKVVKPEKILNKHSSSLIEVIDSEVDNAIYHYDNFRLQQAIGSIWNIVTRSNKYIDETTPWVNGKTEDDINEILYTLYEGLRNITFLINPIMPDSSSKMLKNLNIESIEFNNLKYGKTKSAQVETNVDFLFTRFEIKKELESMKDTKVKLKPLISIDEFEKIDLRVGLVIKAVEIEKSDKLLLLDVKIEEEEFQIVSGIKENYKVDDIIGKFVVVVANLKPVVIRGYESRGMVLAASSSKKSLEVIMLNKEKEFAIVK